MHLFASVFWFETYIQGAERFRDVVAKAGADVLISNHTAGPRELEEAKREYARLK
jgi:hypothetical protein